MFCPDCGSILLPKKIGEKTVLACGSCDYVNKDTEAAKITESVRKESKHDERLLEVAADDNITAPITEAECPRCHNSKAYYWTRQTRAADEGETKFHQCTMCKYKWREYG